MGLCRYCIDIGKELAGWKFLLKFIYHAKTAVRFSLILNTVKRQSLAVRGLQLSTSWTSQKRLDMRPAVRRNLPNLIKQAVVCTRLLQFFPCFLVQLKAN